MLRKLLYTTAAFLCAGTMLFAQSEKATIATVANGVQGISKNSNQALARKSTPSNQVNALFDVQLNYNIQAQRGSAGMAGVVWTGTEFWVSAWNTDSLFTFDANGVITSRFKVTGVGTPTSGVRGMTWDGTHIYAGANTTTIYEIDPVSKTVTSTITAPEFVRGIAYDSLANGGLGGFWICNFQTDITLIDRAGLMLSAIPAATHGLVGIFGIGIDNYSTGGPFIWAFDQEGGTGVAKIKRINVASGAADAFAHDVMSDIGVGGTGGLAGGLGITWGLDPGGARSILGVMQGSPNRMFAYELSDFVPPVTESRLEKLNFNPPFTFVPEFLSGPVFFDADVANFGSAAVDTLSFIINVDSAGTNVQTDTSRLFNFASGAMSNVASTAAFTPSSKSTYDITAFINTGSLVDEDFSNDTVQYSMTVTDSILGMDNDVVEGSLGLQASAGVLGQRFQVGANSYASSVTAYFDSPTAGDSVSFDLYTFGSAPVSVLASTYTYTFTTTDAAFGKLLTLGFKSAPYPIGTGAYFVGAHQYSTDVLSMGYTSFNFQPNACQALFAGSTTWQPLDASFQITFFLRLNILDPLFVSVPQVYKQDAFTMHPNPASSILNVQAKSSSASATLSMFDITGREVFSQIGVEESNTIDLQKFSEGVYFVRMIVDGNAYTEKVTVAK